MNPFKVKLIRLSYISLAAAMLLCWGGFIVISWCIKDILFFVACVFALLWCAEIIWCALAFRRHAQGQGVETWGCRAMLRKLKFSLWLFGVSLVSYFAIFLLVELGVY